MGVKSSHMTHSFLKTKKEAKPSVVFLLAALVLLTPPTQANETAKPTPQQHFQLQTFTNKTLDFNKTIPPLQKSKLIDAEALFQKVIACYPTPSKFDVSVKLKARYGVNDGTTSDISDLGKHYFGIVLAMPLLDSSEQVDRQRKREYDRRKDTAEAIAKFVQSIAKRNQIERQIGLFTALEQRAQVRVQMGMVSVNEQVGHLKSVIKAQENLEATNAAILQNRLSLSGQCQTDRIEAMNAHLRDLSVTAGEVVE